MVGAGKENINGVEVGQRRRKISEPGGWTGHFGE